MIPFRVGMAAPFGFALYALLSHGALCAGLALPIWLWPVCMAGGTALGLRVTRRLGTGEPALPDRVWGGRWTRGLPGITLLGTVALVTWGAVATADREWDGLVSWSLRAAYLIPPADLSDPFFADAAVFSHSYDYPILQPLSLGACLAFGGGIGRLFFPLVFVLMLLLCGALGRSEGLKAPGGALAVGVGLTPMWASTGSGAVDSGYAELFLAYFLTVGAAGLVLRHAGLTAVAAFCLPLVKPEGLPWAVLLGVASAFVLDPRARSLQVAAALGLGASLLLWLPLQAQLSHRSASSPAWVAVPVGFVLLMGVAQARLRWRLRSWIGVGLLAGAGLVAAGLGLEFRASSDGLVREFAGNLADLPSRLLSLPALLKGYLGGFLSVRKLGLLFVILPVAAVLRRRQRTVPVERSLLVFFCGGIAVCCLAILLGDDTDWDHVFKSRFDRLLLQWVGVGWILACSLWETQKSAGVMGLRS